MERSEPLLVHFMKISYFSKPKIECNELIHTMKLMLFTNQDELANLGYEVYLRWTLVIAPF